MCADRSTIRWASAASSRGSTRSTTGRTAPEAMNGHTCSWTSTTMPAFSAGKNYYVNRFGRQNVNLPWDNDEYFEMVETPDLGDFILR